MTYTTLPATRGVFRYLVYAKGHDGNERICAGFRSRIDSVNWALNIMMGRPYNYVCVRENIEEFPLVLEIRDQKTFDDALHYVARLLEAGDDA